MSAQLYTMRPPIAAVEDWTDGEPPTNPNTELLADMRILMRELARLRRIERVAADVLQHHADDHIRPMTQLACLAMVELGSSLLQPSAWRKP